MKLFKKVAVFGIAACFAIGVAALAACEDKDTGEVTDAQWTERLTINLDSVKSGTFTTKSYPTYSKEQAAEYGEWSTHTQTVAIDLVNNILHEVTEEEKYDSGDGTFTTEKSEEYLFSYNNAYYSWRKGYIIENGEPQVEVSAITKSSFINRTEATANEFTIFQIYSQPQYKSQFTYDEATKSYILAQYGTVAASLQFLEDGGVRYIASGTSLLKSEIEYSQIDKTVIGVPASVRADVDAYIAAQQ